MSRQSGICTLAAALALFATTSARAQCDPSKGEAIHLIASPKIELQGAQPQTTLWLAVTRCVAPKTSLDARLVQAAFQQSPDASLADAFELTPELADGKASTGLRITVHRDKLPQPGDYNLTIAIDDAAKHKPLQSVQLVIALPQPALRTIENLSTTVSWPRSPLLNVFLRETSRRGPLTHLSIEQVGNATQNDVAIDARFRSVTEQTVPAGGPLDVVLAADGRFPTGTSKGKLEVRAAELATPLLVNFEVRERLPSFCILIIVILGIGFGNGLRSWLKPLVERSRFEVRVAETVEHCEALRRRYPDQQLRARLAGIEDEIRRAFATQDGDTLKRSLDDADTAIKAARTDLDTRLKEVSAKHDGLATVLERFWSLPQSLESALPRWRSQLDAIRQLIAAHDGDGAKQQLALVERDLDGSTREAVRRWQAQTKQLLVLLFDPSQRLSKAVRDALKPKQEALAQATSALAPAQGEQLDASWHKLETARGALAELLDDLFVALEGEVDAVVTVLGPSPALARAQAAIAMQLARLRAAGADLERLAEAAPQTIRELDRDLSDAILARVARPEDTDAVRALLAQLDYRGAARKARPEAGAIEKRLIAPAQETEKTRSGLAEEKAESPAKLERAQATGVSDVSPVARAKQKLARNEWLVRLLSGALIVAGAYALYVATFVGTWQECAQLFTWAFGLDMTVDAFIGLKKPEATR